MLVQVQQLFKHVDDIIALWRLFVPTLYNTICFSLPHVHVHHCGHLMYELICVWLLFIIAIGYKKKVKGNLTTNILF